jgi:hypothetical protein
MESLTAVATNATMGTGTIRTITPSRPSNVGKSLSNRFANDVGPPAKYKSRITEMIRAFRYGCERLTSAFSEQR